MHVIRNAQLIRNSEQESICFGDCVIASQMLDKNLWFGGVGSAEDGSCLLIEEANFVFFLASTSEVDTIKVIDQREDAPAHRNTWNARVSGLGPCIPKSPNLRGLLDVERFSRLVELERRTLQIHA